MRKKLIFILVLIFLVSGIGSEIKYNYKINLEYSEGNFSTNNVSIEIVEDLSENHIGEHTAEILSSKHELLDIFLFGIPSFLISDSFDPETGELSEGGYFETYEKINFTLYFPYYENAQEIRFYNSDLEEILIIDVSQFSKDYEKKEVLTPEEAEEKRQAAEQDEKTLTNTLYEYWWVLLIILIVLVIILNYSLRKKK